MANLVQTYIIHDSDENLKLRGAIRIKREDAQSYNREGYGIFQTVNQFHGKRKLDRLVHINAWAVDIDSGDKQRMLEKIEAGLKPTMIVETKRGYHVYWKAIDGTRENWDAIVRNRLIPFYDGDKRAKDICRILRVPGFYHMKDPSDPFLVQRVTSNYVEYTERDMFKFYKDALMEKEVKRSLRALKKTNPLEGDFWDRVYNLNCEYALSKLSGSEHVGFEIYSFKQNTTGTLNILVDGKSTSCWIDHDGRIGSADGGGPTIAQWLNWFHKDYTRTVKIIEEVFPECRTQKTIQLSLI